MWYLKILLVVNDETKWIELWEVSVVYIMILDYHLYPFPPTTYPINSKMVIIVYLFVYCWFHPIVTIIFCS